MRSLFLGVLFLICNCGSAQDMKFNGLDVVNYKDKSGWEYSDATDNYYRTDIEYFEYVYYTTETLIYTTQKPSFMKFRDAIIFLADNDFELISNDDYIPPEYENDMEYIEVPISLERARIDRHYSKEMPNGKVVDCYLSWRGDLLLVFFEGGN